MTYSAQFDQTSTIIKNLNPEQYAAATHSSGPALVLAGPGTGKTETLTTRFALLVEQGADPSRIFTVTYTKRAAEEMSRRIKTRINKNGFNTYYIGTFHSIINSLMSGSYHLLGYHSRPRIFDDRQSRRLMSQRRLFWKNEADLLEVIAVLKNNLVGPEAIESWTATIPEQERQIFLEASPLYQEYQAALRKENAIDFADMFLLANKLLSTNEIVRGKIGSFFDHILIDEYQDINPAQFSVLMHIAHKCKNVWVVGDDDQSLYGFRGSSVDYIHSFSNDFPDAKIYHLTKSYRCAPQIIKGACSLVAKNHVRYEKQLTSAVSKDARIRITQCENEEAEAAVVVNTIERLITKGVPKRKIAVLFRTPLIAQEITSALRARGIPFVLRGVSDFWQHPAIRSLTAALRYVADSLDASAEAMLGMSKRAQAIKEVIPQIKNLTFVEQAKALSSVILGFCPPTNEAQQIWSQHLQIAIEKASTTAALEPFLKLMDEESRRIPDMEENDVIILSTIHSAKGLEWYMVILVACESGIMPARKSDDLEEERRVAYVAVTRAEKGLLITHSLSRGGQNGIKPSPYIDDFLTGLSPGDAGLSRARLINGKLHDILLPSDKRPDKQPAASRHDPRIAKIPMHLCSPPTLRGQKWTTEQDALLSTLWRSGKTVPQIIEAIPRTPAGIFARLVLLKMIPQSQDPYNGN